eukprot:COSAG01_NODE_5078_length_4502_cov_6.740177_1_plen_401_part_10
MFADEILDQCRDLGALFLLPDSKISEAGLAAVRRRCPGARCVELGRQVSRAQLLELLRVCGRTKRLDVCLVDARLTDAGLRELAALCSDVEALFTNLSSGHELLRLLFPGAICVSIGAEITFEERDQVCAAYKELEARQNGIRQLALSDGVKLCGDHEAVAVRNTARQAFVDATRRLSEVMADGSHMAIRAARSQPGSADYDGWVRLGDQLKFLEAYAEECARMIAQSEPKPSKAALQKLHEKEDTLRGEARACRARLELAEQEAASPSPRRVSDGAELQRTSTTPEQQAARAALLARPMQDWSEEQVQEWIGVIGLPAEQVELVQRVLADEETDGDELQNMRERWLVRRLQRAGATDAAGLAKQTMALHEMAQGAAPAEDRLMAAKTALDTTRAELRQTT